MTHHSVHSNLSFFIYLNCGTCFSEIVTSLYSLHVLLMIRVRLMKVFVILGLSLTLPLSHPTPDSVFLSVASYEESSCCESASSSPVRKGLLATNEASVLQKCICKSFKTEAAMTSPQIAVLLMTQVWCTQIPVYQRN